MRSKKLFVQAEEDQQIRVFGSRPRGRSTSCFHAASQEPRLETRRFQSCCVYHQIRHKIQLRQVLLRGGCLHLPLLSQQSHPARHSNYQTFGLGKGLQALHQQCDVKNRYNLALHEYMKLFLLALLGMLVCPTHMDSELHHLHLLPSHLGSWCQTGQVPLKD